MRTILVVGALVLSVLSACGLDRAGEAPVPHVVVPGPTASVREADPGTPDASTGTFSDPAAAGADAGGPATPLDAADATPRDGGDDATSSAAVAASVDAAGSAAGPCELLHACCPRLVVPQVVIPCLIVAAQDGGEANCAKSLADLDDAGVCP